MNASLQSSASSGQAAAALEPTLPAKNSQVLLTGITDLVSEQIGAVNKYILQQLDSDVVLIRQLGAYIVGSGGKRLRPILVLLSAGANGYKGKDHVTLAAVIEFIHTATLLHDDVVDASSLRRGKKTANEVWGNEASVLVGDFLYSRSFQMMVSVNDMRVMDLLADTTNAIAEGEVMQLLNAHSPETTETKYFDTIERKTARLFASAAELGAIICDQSAKTREAMSAYGLHLGNAFQLIDDVLDYRGDVAEIGKNCGDDLAEGKPTLPIIQALKLANSDQQQLISTAIENGDREKIDQIVEIIESTGALAYTSRRAQEEAEIAKQALISLPETSYKTAMLDLADFAVSRSY